MLERLAAQHEISALLTRPDAPQGRGRKIAAPPAKLVAEQAAAGLDRLSEAEYARFEAMNAAYREKFGLPFILCVKRHGRASLLRHFAARLASDPATERATAEAEVFRIAAIRLGALVTGEGALRTTGRISTHVLDTATGTPAVGVPIRLETRTGEHLDQGTTDADGRIGSLGGELGNGDYVLRFDTAAYAPGFFPEVVVVFTIADERATNPFMRAASGEELAKRRAEKDNHKG